MARGEILVFPMPKGGLEAQLGVLGGWWVSSWFGGRPSPFTGVPSWHGGMDLVAPRMTPLYAVKGGQLFQGWDQGGGGNWTRLACDDGDMFGYGHAAMFAVGPNGRHVEAGEIVAYVNSTGSSTGNHLHFAYQPAGWARYGDPFDLLAACRTFIGSPVALPEGPAPLAPVIPLHPEHSLEEILAMHRFWSLDGNFYAVGLEPYLSPDAVGADGQAQSPLHFVGGMYVYRFLDPAAFTLAVGTATQPEILDRGNADHAALIRKLESLPGIYQAA